MALEQILAVKRRELAARRAERSLESLLATCTPARRSLRAALAAGRPGFLLEIKFASPSEGRIRADPALEPVLASYGRHADAISVLTDRTFFGGSLERLAEVSARVERPVLCKDFVLEPYQVAEARAHGADAVLLILAALDDAAWQACAETAARLGMEVLTEVHDAAEARRAAALPAPLVGINNRNLRTLAVDPGTVARLAPLLPADRLLVAESGLGSREDVVAVAPLVDAVLVGTALMRAPGLDEAVRRLVYGRTKVCGLTSPGDARAALAAGATHGGLVFAPASPRRVTLAAARPIAAAAPLAWVGVFTDAAPELVARHARELGLAAVQLHGAEDPATVAGVRALVPEGCEVWKAVPGRAPLPSRADRGADRLLLDGGAPGGPPGGTGRRFDWAVLAGYAELGEALLAGGLDPANAAEAARWLPWALDVSSGVESEPGRKDAARLAAFFRARRRLAVRGAAA
jgi:indole-3-glycerol phosphate synthase/phosphoribosylanthranilate isomerase